MSAERVGCPACGSRAVKRIETIESTTVLHCAECATRRVDPIPDASVLHEVYQHDYYTSSHSREVGYGEGENASGVERTNRARLAAIRRLLPEGSRILEVGAGRGALGGILAPHYEYTGLELSAEGAGEAAARGLRVVTADLDSYDSAERYDAIVMIHVFEHLPHPAAALARMHRLLADRGIVYLVTPDAASPLARLSGRRWVSYKFPEHVILYSRRGLSHLLNDQGFAVERTVADREYCDHAFLSSRLRGLSPKLAAASRLLLPLAPKLLLVPSGAVGVIARKR